MMIKNLQFSNFSKISNSLDFSMSSICLSNSSAKKIQLTLLKKSRIILSFIIFIKSKGYFSFAFFFYRLSKLRCAS
jgi:predicted patatin/cPLA2 family phospholipase